jgi:uncharacterized repeat protein (TIGR03803 family)
MQSLCADSANLPTTLKARLCGMGSQSVRKHQAFKDLLNQYRSRAQTLNGADNNRLSAAPGETVLYNFVPYEDGLTPSAKLCLGPGGRLYGTTQSGGPNNAGVVFRVNDAGKAAVLYRFTGGADGGTPIFGLTCDSPGKLYGATTYGGANGVGVLFKLNADGHYRVLYTFTGGADGAFPVSALLQDWTGSLYGVTSQGGDSGAGVVFKLDSEGRYKVLYSFTGGSDGGVPVGDLVMDSAGNLYGTTLAGGSTGSGVLFRMDKQGQETVLYDFSGGDDGAFPFGITRDSVGTIYGAAMYGGAAGAGVIFKLDSDGHFSVLYSFTGGSDGGGPNGATRDCAGNLYGTTNFGGDAGVGVVFKLDANGQYSVLHTFTGPDGAGPYLAGVVVDGAGNLYGDASGGGQAGGGTVFKINAMGQESTIYSFPGTDGNNPSAGITRDSLGNSYGTTQHGGPHAAGTVFKIDHKGRESILYNFSGGADGAYPQGGVVKDSAGNLYGTAAGGGSGGQGVVFKLDTRGHQTVLYNFSGADGAYPNDVIMDATGNLYGTTEGGGTSAKGTIFKLDTMGHETVLHSFTGADGAYPYTGVTMDSAGNLYGSTTRGGPHPNFGVVYKLDTSQTYTILHGFTGGADGGFVWGSPIVDASGNVYGATWSGGPPSGDYPGVVYKVDAGGQFSVLYTFTGFADGGGSRSNLVMDMAGNLYGTTQYGGQGPCSFFGCGVVFKLDPNGQQTVLYSFTGGSDGSEPGTGLTRGADGTLFGTTEFGGAAASGAVFQLTPQ